MPRRKQAAQQQAAGPHPATELRGQNAEGQVRPADNRYLTADEIATRDDYVAEVTGEDAQQLVVKREAPDHVEAISSRDRGDDNGKEAEQ